MATLIPTNKIGFEILRLFLLIFEGILCILHEVVTTYQ